ncbi:MAG: cystathionine beta-lyase, partial [Alphaproteobacteria bacterium]|nr:cystathionine beta-lyase [Alphaproteobacteria bacterium]
MKRDTVLTHAGRYPRQNHGIVNPPVYHASTVLYPSLDDFEAAGKKREYGKTYYGLGGTPTTFSFEEAVAKLEGAFRARAVGSGLAAITAPLMACLQAGDHLLMVDNVYSPSRRFCDGMLKRYGVETTYYDPTIGADVARLFRANTKVLFLEAPGSLTFEMQDVPAMVAVARKAGIVTMMDNTWASPYYFRPLEHGIDISIQAATKYLCGHSDVIMGTVASNEAHADRVDAAVRDLGFFASPDDCYLVMRGMRTMAVRLPRHWQTGLTLAHWLRQQPEVDRVFHPALPGDPGHAIWTRDFQGSTGLFSFGFKAI